MRAVVGSKALKSFNSRILRCDQGWGGTYGKLIEGRGEGELSPSHAASERPPRAAAGHGTLALTLRANADVKL